MPNPNFKNKRFSAIFDFAQLCAQCHDFVQVRMEAQDSDFELRRATCAAQRRASQSLCVSVLRCELTWVRHGGLAQSHDIVHKVVHAPKPKPEHWLGRRPSGQLGERRAAERRAACKLRGAPCAAQLKV